MSRARMLARKLDTTTAPQGETHMTIATFNTVTANRAARRVIQHAMKGATATVETITPAIARAYLDQNHRNRRVRKFTVKLYAALMEKGAWMLGTDGIGFDAEGYLLNGQHRLLAVIESGVAQEFVVVRGLDPDVFRHLDNGARRNLADALHMMGYQHYDVLAPTAKRLAFYARAGKLNRAVADKGTSGAPGQPSWADLEDQFDLIDGYAPLLDHVAWAASRAKHARRFGVTATQVAMLLSLYQPWHPGIHDFLDRVFQFQARSDTDPARILAARLMDAHQGLSNTKMDSATAFGYMVMAANADKKGRSIKKLQWPTKDVYPQPLTHVATQIAEAASFDPRAA